MSEARRTSRAFLLEIGTEEVPAGMIEPALKDLTLGLFNEIVAGRLAPDLDFHPVKNFSSYGTPRRLAVLATGLLGSQPDREEEVTGPPVKSAYDPSGRPTKAAEGFARAHGVAAGELRRVSTPKGECLAVRRTLRGSPAAEVLAERVPRLIESMTFPKMMRWGKDEGPFVRPIRSIVALLDGEVVGMTTMGVRSGRDTFAHRVSGRSRISLGSPTEYVDALRRNGIVTDIGERKGMIEEALLGAAAEAGGRIAPPPGSGGGDGDPKLLDEVKHLVEWPTVISGEFDRAFLDLPAEILVTAMRHHQKSFSLLGPDGALLNRFLAVADTADRTGAIRRGYEWVLQARLTDARFFWEDDRKALLADRCASLERVTFHEKLGSYAAKTRRMARLVTAILPAFERAGRHPDAAATAHAALLCKNDLTTQMVKEFPELEGIVGGLYARADGLPEAEAAAISSHYLPRTAEDPLPATPEAAILSLADRFDTQAGIFLLGIVPTGSRDPYALRRSVQGACRILIEMKVPLSLAECLDQALEAYGDPAIEGAAPRGEARARLLEFYRGREQFLGEAASLRQDSVRAALAASMDDPLDARLRMEALEAMRREADFGSLVAAHKRIKNILPKGAGGPTPARPSGLKEKTERDLHAAIDESRAEVDAAVRRRDYPAALRSIALLRTPLDRFFEGVMVMAEDRAVRESRFALLAAAAGLFMRVADFSEIVQEGEPAAPGQRRARG